VYAADPVTHQLELVEITGCGGSNPRDFMLYRDLLIVANQSSDNIAVFKVDQSSGKITATGQNITCRAPVCLILTEDG
jgi:3-carboxymuconate cyclase